MSYIKIAAHINDSIGLNVNNIGMITVSNAIDRRMRKCRISEKSAYLKLIENSPDEMTALTEAVIVPETWFMRDIKAYKEIANHIRFLRRNNITTISILCIPCSTGEEPYSIAMHLRKAGIPDSYYNIDAADISIKSIEKAKAGRYKEHSFRSIKNDYIKKNFTLNNDEYAISNTLRDKVNFYQENILSPSSTLLNKKYNIIICQNLLIYFDSTTKTNAFTSLSKIISKNGILILGHAESARESNNQFSSNSTNSNSTYKRVSNKKNQGNTVKTEKNESRGGWLLKSINSPLLASLTLVKKTDNHSVNRGTNLDKPIEYLDNAYKYADQGRFEDALKNCNLYLKQNKFSANAYYLVGVINDSMGFSQKATAHIKKALYLDPNHLNATIHLSLMAEQRGDCKESTLLRERAQRIQERSLCNEA